MKTLGWVLYGFGETKFAYSGLVLSSSQFSLMSQAALKNNIQYKSSQNWLKNYHFDFLIYNPWNTLYVLIIKGISANCLIWFKCLFWLTICTIMFYCISQFLKIHGCNMLWSKSLKNQVLNLLVDICEKYLTNFQKVHKCQKLILQNHTGYKNSPNKSIRITTKNVVQWLTTGVKFTNV